LTNIQKYIPDLDRQFVSLENGLSRSIEWYKGVL